MKRTSTQQPVIPQGYTGDMRHFNQWQSYLLKQMDKIKGLRLTERNKA